MAAGEPIEDRPTWGLRRLVRGMLASVLFKERWAETKYTNTQVPTYNTTSGKFEPGTPSGTGAPTDADYLVGTANATLSAEIVVGTTPGGELGGTWPSPTVDATHSGSTHAATQAAAEATAASELSTHAGAADPHTGYVREADANWIDLTDTGATTLHSHAGGAALTVQEEDGAPIDTAVTIIRVPNGTLTDNGAGDVSLGYPTPAGIQDSSYVYAADGAGSDDYAITLTPTPAVYAAGQRFIFIAQTANTGTATLAVNGQAPKTIKKFKSLDLETGDIVASQVVEVVYDGSNFQMVSPVKARVRIHKLCPSAAAGAAIAAGNGQDFSYTGPNAETVQTIMWVCQTVGTLLTFGIRHSGGTFDFDSLSLPLANTVDTEAIGTAKGGKATITGDTTIEADSLISLDIDSFTGTYKDMVVFVVTTY